MHYKLAQEIILLSNAQNWDSAKKEWDFTHAYMSDFSQTCLCGHYPIKEICVIANSENGNQTEVGNCCVNKFLGIESGNKIFTSIKRVKEDVSKSMSAEVLEYLFEKKAIDNFEYEFYSDVIRKRNFSEKQLNIKERINKKLIAFTSYELNSHFSKINRVLKWAESRPNFDKTFVISLKDSCTKRGKLSEKQLTALENILSRWKIE